MSVDEVIRRLPEISIVQDRSRAMAMLDAIMSPEWESRFFSFDSQWAPKEEMASMRDGCGNEYSIVFSLAGAFARGFDHECYQWDPPAIRPDLIHRVPEAFRAQLEEPAFCDDGALRATVCFWREHEDAAWSSVVVQILPDGEECASAEWLFEVLLDGSPEGYQRFAQEYFEVEMDLEAVRHIYALRPLTQSVVSSLNPDVSLASLAGDIAEIGYPVTG
ncbi:hypothetical protein [Nonomuraea sp. NPDC050786]|uniref:hypothetical protein n=1 Tax=Nonomuraea sp. NPDC050786 TaxID=3154840 RepID=UPI0033FD1807